MVRSSASATPTTKRATSHWLRHSATSTTSTRPRHFRRRRTHHGCPCLEDRCMLLCCSSADTQHSTVCQQAGATISRHVTRAVVLGLWKCDSCRHSQVPTGASAVDPQYSSTSHLPSPQYDHVSPLLQELHWLSVPERIKYWLAVLVFRCRYDMAPEYMARDLSSVGRRLTLQTASPHVVQSAADRAKDQTFSLSAIMLSVPLLLVFATVYL